MEMQRIETIHHTPEQIAAYLDATAELTRGHYREDEVPVEVFVAVLNLVAAKTINVMQQAPMQIGLPTMAIPRGRG